MAQRASINRSLIYAALIVGALVMLVPLFWMLLTSLKSFSEVVASPPIWWPAKFQWHNYYDALTEFNFVRYLLNSLFVTTMTIAGTLFSCTLAAYAFGCLEVRGRDFIFA